MKPIPSLRWSLFWMGLLCFLIFCCVLNILDDPSTVGEQAIMILLFCGCLVVAHKHYLKVIEQREAWRDERFLAWLRKDLPAPGETDWGEVPELPRSSGARGLWQIR